MCFICPCFFSNHVIDLEIPSDIGFAERQEFASFSDKEEKDIRGKDALKIPRILASAQPGSKRKRGRPAGTSTKKGKAGVDPAQRRRTQIRKKLAKISSNASDECGSDDGNTCKEESKPREQNYGLIGKKKLEIQETEMVEDSESSQRSKPPEQECVEDVRHEEWFNRVPEIEMSEKHNSEDSKKPDRLEMMTDPVDAMLLDMIPSLGKEILTANKNIEDEKPSADLNAPSVDMNAEPTKKKKVSYKDVAGELLKDW